MFLAYPSQISCTVTSGLSVSWEYKVTFKKQAVHHSGIYWNVEISSLSQLGLKFSLAFCYKTSNLCLSSRQWTLLTQPSKTTIKTMLEKWNSSKIALREVCRLFKLRHGRWGRHPRPAMANLIKGARPNILCTSKKFFLVSMGSWRIPQLLLIIALLLLLMHIIITAWYNYYIMFLIKSSSSNTIRKK